MLKVRSGTFHPRLARMDSATVDFQMGKGDNAANFVRLPFTGLSAASGILKAEICNLASVTAWEITGIHKLGEGYLYK